MRSTRHWNVERHILNRHGELGRPINGLTKAGPHPKQYSDINASYILGSMISDVRNAQLSPQKSREQQPNKRFSDLLETMFLDPMRKIVEFNSLRSQLFRGTYQGTYQGGFSPLNFSSTRPSHSPASHDALHNIEDNPNTQQFFRPQRDFEIIAFRGYVCEQCLIAHPLPVYRWKVNESGTLRFEMPHKCDPKRLSELPLIL
jgi:hypothetical protein